MDVVDVAAWVCSATSIASTYLAGRKSLWGPAFGVIGVVPWSVFAICGENWGLLPVTLVITVLQARNLYLWRQDALNGLPR